MDNEKLNYAQDLKNRITNLENDLNTCDIMLNNGHNHLYIKSSSMGFSLPSSLVDTILTIAKKILEKELESAVKEFAYL